MRTVDLIVPSYNEEESLPLFYSVMEGIIGKIEGHEFNYIFVNDGSRDRTLDVIREMAGRDPHVKYVSFSRNFGKEAAIYAGLTNSTGDLTILIDADLQHPPTLIPDMIRAVEEEGYEACGAKRETGFFSRSFTSINNRISDTKLQKGATDFMCMSRAFVDAVLKMSENRRFTKGLFAWVGFKVKWIDYVQEDRIAGQTKWNFKKLLGYASEGLMAFSTFPLKLVTVFGAVVFILSIVYIIITLVRTLICGIEVPGYVTTLVVLLFMGGVIMLAIGILGEYVAKIYMEVKDRPIYIMEETNIKDGKNIQQ